MPSSPTSSLRWLREQMQTLVTDLDREVGAYRNGRISNGMIRIRYWKDGKLIERELPLREARVKAQYAWKQLRYWNGALANVDETLGERRLAERRVEEKGTRGWGFFSRRNSERAGRVVQGNFRSTSNRRRVA
ncbi:MAG: hypothetical protein AABY11_01830 [archaeon]